MSIDKEQDHTQPIQTILENHNYIVRAYWGADDSRNIIVSFTGIGAPERYDGTFFGAALALKLNIPWVGIIDRHDNWYCEGNREAVVAVVRAWIDVRRQSIASDIKPKLVGFGISMGAYAVLKYSRLLGFDYVMAAAPQWSLDAVEAPYPSHFKHLYKPFMKGMGIRANDVHGRIYVFYDPYTKSDRDEVEALKRYVCINEIAICHAGHMVLSSLKGSRTFLKILNHLDDAAAIRTISVVTRRHNSDNITRMIEHSFNHDQRLTLQAFRTQRFASMIETISGETLNRLWEIAANLTRMGHICEANAFFTRATGNHSICITLPRLMSWRGELLCYSHGSAIFSQTVHHLPERGSMVTVVDNALFAVTPVGLVPVPGKLAPLEGGRYAIVLDDLYLSARTDERVEPIPHLQAWEEFTLLPARG